MAGPIDVESCTLRIRRRLLRDPTVALAADYLVLERTAARREATIAVLPAALVDDARQLNTRRTLASGGADAVLAATVRRHTSIPRRCLGFIRAQFAPMAVVKSLPWTIIIPYIFWTVATRTWSRPQLIASASFEVPSTPLSETNHERTNLLQAIDSLWASKFAKSVLDDLPGACSAELAAGAPSAHCIRDLVAKLHRILTAERHELEVIDQLLVEIDDWCPAGANSIGPMSARLLFEPDEFSALLEPFGADDTPASCRSATYARRRALAATRVKQYRQLVRLICNKSTFAIKALLVHLPRPTSSDIGMDDMGSANVGAAAFAVDLGAADFGSANFGLGAGSADVDMAPAAAPGSAALAQPPARPYEAPSQYAHGYATIVIDNHGGAAANLDLQDVTIAATGFPCERAMIVSLDPYSHMPQDVAITRHATLAPGASFRLQLELKCKTAFALFNAWSLHVGAFDVPFAFATQNGGI